MPCYFLSQNTWVSKTPHFMYLLLTLFILLLPESLLVICFINWHTEYLPFTFSFISSCCDYVNQGGWVNMQHFTSLTATMAKLASPMSYNYWRSEIHRTLPKQFFVHNFYKILYINFTNCLLYRNTHKFYMWSHIIIYNLYCLSIIMVSIMMTMWQEGRHIIYQFFCILEY